MNNYLRKKKRINIEIKGVNFINKGAELMLLSIIDEFRERGFDADFAMNIKDIRLATEGYEYMKLLPWRYSNKYPFIGPSIHRLFKFIPNQKLLNHSILFREDIDLILDASGFVYSDQWGAGAAEVMARKIKEDKEKGKTTVLLPQAFGPFTSSRIKDAMRSVLSQADLIFARDKISYSYLDELKVKSANLHQCPDFTNKMKSKRPSNIEEVKGSVCIIPNYRMIDKTNNDSKSYLNFFYTACSCLDGKDIDYYFLIHEMQDDSEIVNSIAGRLHHDVKIIHEKDPRKIKGYIKESRFVIGSRYHGIISAINQNVPVIASGWSHKYQMLLQEYSLEKWYCGDIESDDIESLINELIDECTFQEYVSKLNVQNDKNLQAVNKMWDKVFSLIK